MIPLQKYTTVGDNKKKSRNLTSRLSHQHKRDKKREQHPLDKLKPRQANISLVFSHLKTIRRQDIMCVCVYVAYENNILILWKTFFLLIITMASIERRRKDNRLEIITILWFEVFSGKDRGEEKE